MLQAVDIDVNYGKKQVLQHASLHAKKGDCIGILGVNGCGKSTLLKVLAGVCRPKNGTVFYDGEDACKKPDLFTKYTGYVPQDNPLIEELSVLDNLKLWYAGKSKNLKMELENGILHTLELHAIQKQCVRTLSGGMKKRLSIGCAMAGRPAVLILDEPTASLDLACKEDIRQLLNSYKKQGGTIIITTHEEPDLALCSRMLLLKQGSLTELPSTLRGQELSSCIAQASVSLA